MSAALGIILGAVGAVVVGGCLAAKKIKKWCKNIAHNGWGQ